MDDEVAKAKAQKKTDALFVLACARGYLGDVSALLEQGASILAVDKRKISGLHYACGQGRSEVVAFLWSKGIELDAEDPSGNLPLHYAVSYGKEQVVDVLLQKGCWTEGSNNLDDTVLHIAARKGYSGILKKLLEHGAKAVLKDVNKRGLTAFGEAVIAGHLEAARLLHSAGAKLHDSCRPWSLLHVCVSASKTAAVSFLLEAGADLHVSADDGETPLHCAAKQGNLELVKLLIQFGAELDCYDAQSRMPKDLVKGNKELLRWLDTKIINAKAVPPKPKALKSDFDIFKESSPEKQLERIRQLAGIKDHAQLTRHLSEFPLEFATQLKELTKLQHVYNIQQVVVEILDDDDFQQQSKDPEALQAVKEIQEDRQAIRRFAESKPQLLSFLQILTRFQAVVRANGDLPVPFQSLLRSSEDGYHDKSKLRLKGMELMLARRKQAARAAALADNELDAKRAAEWEMDPKNDGRQHPVTRKSSSSQLPTTEIQPDETPSKSARRKPVPDFAIPEELDEYGLPALPPREPFSWQRLKSELVKALRNTVLLFLACLAFSYWQTGKLFWQNGSTDAPVRHNENSEYEL